MPGLKSDIPGSFPPIHRRAIVFDEGLIGCPDWKHFVLEPEAAGPVIQALRSLDNTEVAFFAVDPFTIVPDYEFDVPDADAAALELADPGEALVLALLTIHDEPPGVTANLLGPLVINVRTGRGKQLVLASSEYSVRHVVLG